MHDHEAVAQALSEAGADFEETGMDTNGVPLLILAVRQGHEVVAQALRESAANATQCPLADGEDTALFFAAKGGHVAVVQVLLEADAGFFGGHLDTVNSWAAIRC